MSEQFISPKLDVRFNRVQRCALAVGVIGAVLGILAYFSNSHQFFFAYLSSFMLFFGLMLGSIAAVCLHHLVGGRWGYVIRRPLEAGARTVPLIAIFFIPLILGRIQLYKWMTTGFAPGMHKGVWFNVPFFYSRTVFYFVLWAAMAAFLTYFSRRQDRAPSARMTSRMRMFAGPILVLYFLTASAASYDWVMSLTPDWYSTIYGFLIVAGQGLAIFAFCTIVVMLLSKFEPLSKFISRNDFNDLGNLLLTFVILWAYMAFSQYLIIWAGNGREEISWYADRVFTGWRVIAALLILGHFALPFVLLLSRSLKRNSLAISGVAIIILVMRWVDTMWMVEPAARHGGIMIHWMDIVLPLALGGFWVAYFIRQLRSQPLLALHAPEAEGHHEY